MTERLQAKLRIHQLVLALVMLAQTGALAQAPSQVTITLVRWPFT